MAAFTLETGSLEHALAALFWPFVRIGSCLMVAPVFGAAAVPPRVRVMLAVVVTLLVTPLLPPSAPVAAFSGPGMLITVQQVLIGTALGLCLQLCFDAVNLGGQLLANTMGLSFAFNMDPERGRSSSTPALGELYTLLVTLTFLVLNGPLTLIETLVGTFTTLPLAPQGFGASGLHTVVLWGAELFRGALAVALPGLTALVIVQVAFGVMSRAAPALNLFAVGLPVSLLSGFAILLGGLVGLQAVFVRAVTQALRLLATLVGS